MKHTSAPWEFVLHDDGDTSGVTFEIRMGSRLLGKNGWEPQHRIDYEVSDKQSSPRQFAEAEANARLISASPLLLSALKACAMRLGVLVLAHGAFDSANAAAIDLANAAVAKAEGR